MRLSARSFVPVALALTICRAGATQQFDTLPIDSGTVTRIDLTWTRPVQGRLLQTFTPSSSVLTFCHYPGPPCATFSDTHAQTVPVVQLIGLEVAHGTHLLKGVLIGGAISLPIAFFLYGRATGSARTRNAFRSSGDWLSVRLAWDSGSVHCWALNRSSGGRSAGSGPHNPSLSSEDA
jgi:hypothetical protein